MRHLTWIFRGSVKIFILAAWNATVFLLLLVKETIKNSLVSVIFKQITFHKLQCPHTPSTFLNWFMVSALTLYREQVQPLTPSCRLFSVFSTLTAQLQAEKGLDISLLFRWHASLISFSFTSLLVSFLLSSEPTSDLFKRNLLCRYSWHTVLC